MDPQRVTWYRGRTNDGPPQTIGVLELREDGFSRVAFADRTEVDGRAHIILARRAWGPKTERATRWWSLVLDSRLKAVFVRNGSCGDPITPEDVPRIVRALEELDLHAPETMVAVDGANAVFPWHPRKRQNAQGE